MADYKSDERIKTEAFNTKNKTTLQMQQVTNSEKSGEVVFTPEEMKIAITSIRLTAQYYEKKIIKPYKWMLVFSILTYAVSLILLIAIRSTN